MFHTLIACQVLLAVVFAASAAGKLRSRRAFGEFVSAASRLAPRWVVGGRRGPGPSARGRGLALVLVAAEAAVPPLLFLPGRGVAGFTIAAFLLVAFTAAIAVALRRAESVSCRCFGRSVRALSPAHVVRNLVLTAVAVTGLALGPAAANSAPSPVGFAAALALGGFAALLVLLLDDMLDLFLPPEPRSLTAS